MNLTLWYKPSYWAQTFLSSSGTVVPIFLRPCATPLRVAHTKPPGLIIIISKYQINTKSKLNSPPNNSFKFQHPIWTNCWTLLLSCGISLLKEYWPWRIQYVWGLVSLSPNFQYKLSSRMGIKKPLFSHFLLFFSFTN